jgi:hypothetical protein
MHRMCHDHPGRGRSRRSRHDRHPGHRRSPDTTEIEGLIRPRYRVFPVADHLADKLCATIGSYPRTGQPASSSRVKDLVDIAIIAGTQPDGVRICLM